MEPMLLNELFVDYDYFQTMGIELIAGRNFSIEHSSDVRQAFIINEAAAKAFRWTNPIGKRIAVGHPGQTTEVREGFVVGVVKDFNTLSLHKKIEPVILRLPWDSWPGNSLNIRVKNSLSETLPAIKATYEKLMPGMLADIRIVEDLHERQYQNEDRAFTSLQVGTIVIILISAFGIFSLSLYVSVKRMKEFGIRKVLGASLGQIVWLHVGYFLKIVLIANLIALPLAYWLVEEWLSDFAYRTNLSLLIFFSVIGISCLLVIISGGYSALKAGSLNPVDVIKTQQ
jgi:putative ABC transport system permease protein